MINTGQTSVAPPPLPPRLGRSQPILIPAPLSPPGQHNKPLIHFLIGLVMLHLLLSVGGFFYLYYKENHILAENKPLAQGRVGFSPSKQEASSSALASMVVEQSSEKAQSSGYLQWNMRHSVRKNINFFHNSWLTILEPGDYYVYSRVTFSKGNPKIPLASKVKLRKTESEEQKVVMMAYCSLSSSHSSESNPHMCTATQMELITLEKGNQLSVWVPDLSLVDYEEGATTFGMYKV
ncbi:CD40 ligand [Odontesthes bonariensis]|uniref:CD40 ligand n=1 Tax=Odontesthes bonariensis TaxID=219752 RepID=UPI003F582744